MAFRLPRDFTPQVLAQEYKALDPTVQVDTQALIQPREQGEILFVQIGLWVLSGGLFGFIWLVGLVRSLQKLRREKHMGLRCVVGCFVPFVSLFCVEKMRKNLLSVARQQDVQLCMKKRMLLSCQVLPLLFINVPAMARLQQGLNRIYESSGEREA